MIWECIPSLIRYFDAVYYRVFKKRCKIFVLVWRGSTPTFSRFSIFFEIKEVNVGYASGVMVLAVTNTGEPGYSLYIPSEFALQIYDNLMKIGRDYGIKNVGHLAMRWLRIEKFIPFWGDELNGDITPHEVNRLEKRFTHFFLIPVLYVVRF